jgi:hypothetical protein
VARASRNATQRARRTPSERSRRFADNRLQSPTIDWTSGVPEQFRFPPSRDLKGMSVSELNAYLERFGILEPWQQAKVSAAGYVQRMTSIPPGSEAFRDEVSRIVGLDNPRGALSMTRRAYRELSLVDAVSGGAREYIWISDGDESTCARCGSRGGDIDTLVGHAKKGLPGPGVCEGGDYCRCELVPVD